MGVPRRFIEPREPTPKRSTRKLPLLAAPASRAGKPWLATSSGHGRARDNDVIRSAPPTRLSRQRAEAATVAAELSYTGHAMPTSSVPLTPLLELARAHLGASPQATAERMPGGMSSRCFYRVRWPEPAPSTRVLSAVGMYHPDPSRSDEAISETAPIERLPFVAVQRLLAQHGVRVPKLLTSDPESGWLLVEDLGDQTLAEALERSPERRTVLYQRAVADLARAQMALDPLPSEHLVTRRSFDRDLLHWEVEHFREYALQAQGMSLSTQQDQIFTRAAHCICERISSMRYGFVHRDYQSRNLMVIDRVGSHEPELVWIDFQDALCGPRTYDLVALLHDSYQDLSEDFIQARLGEYCELRGIEDTDAVRQEFDWVTVQRKLKDAGRFVYFDRRTGDQSYLRFVQPTVQKVRHALARLDETPELRQLAALLRDKFACST